MLCELPRPQGDYNASFFKAAIYAQPPCGHPQRRKASVFSEYSISSFSTHLYNLPQSGGEVSCHTGDPGELRWETGGLIRLTLDSWFCHANFRLLLIKDHGP